MRSGLREIRFFFYAAYAVVTICLLIVFINLASQLSHSKNAAVNKEAAATPRQVRFNMISGAPDPNEIFARVNDSRIKNGLPPLNPNPKLAAIADLRAGDMANRNYYAHKNPDGKYYYDYLPEINFSNKNYSCENLDLQFTQASEQYVMDWLKSNKGHRKCMLDRRISEAGYAVAPTGKISGGQTAYIVVAIHAESN